MELNTIQYIGFITSDPTTGSVADADFTPTVDVFDEDIDTPLITISAVKRTGLTGNYRVKLEATEANGFQKDHSYVMVAKATVAGVSGKTVINNFIITNTMDILLDVARSLNVSEVPESFVFDYTVPMPTMVESPLTMFGDPARYEFSGVFLSYYDTTLKVWRDGLPGSMPLDIKADVLLQQIAYDNYLSELKDWNIAYNDQKWAEYRKHLAQTLIDVCA